MRLCRPPSLVVVVPMEGGEAYFAILAATREDEVQLRSWLRRSGRLDCVAEGLAEFLDRLDELDEEGAA